MCGLLGEFFFLDMRSFGGMSVFVLLNRWEMCWWVFWGRWPAEM